MKKTTIIIERLRGAWAALRAKPYNMATVEIGMRRCEECDYYKTAHEPAEIVENNQNATEPRYFHEITYMDGLVLVVLYEATEDGPKELARSHGHIIHEGVEGIAQAASYAMRGVWYKVQSTK